MTHTSYKTLPVTQLQTECSSSRFAKYVPQRKWSESEVAPQYPSALPRLPQNWLPLFTEHLQGAPGHGPIARTYNFDHKVNWRLQTRTYYMTWLILSWDSNLASKKSYVLLDDMQLIVRTFGWCNFLATTYTETFNSSPWKVLKCLIHWSSRHLHLCTSASLQCLPSECFLSTEFLHDDLVSRGQNMLSDVFPPAS